MVKYYYREGRGQLTVNGDFSPLRYGKSLIYKKINASEKLIIKCKELIKILNFIVKYIKKNLEIIDN